MMTAGRLFLLSLLLLCSIETCLSSELQSHGIEVEKENENNAKTHFPLALVIDAAATDDRTPNENHAKTKRRQPHFPPALVTGAATDDPSPVEDGLTFSRNIKHLNASFHLELEGNHCLSHDKYGANICHYDWGDDVLGNYTVKTPRMIQHGDTMSGSFHIDYVVPYEFTCLLCGEPCVFEIPVLEVTRTLDMPPCPIGPSYHNRIREKLMKFSPTGGIKTKLEGTVVMTTKEGNVIAEFSVSARVK